MENIKSYLVFESEVNKKLSDILNNDSFLSKWRMNIEIEEDNDGFTDNCKCYVNTAYGEKTKLNFYSDGGEYAEPGNWDFRSSAIDQYGIEYIVSGVGIYDYPDDEGVNWYVDEAVSRFTDEFEIVKFIENIIEKDPLLCSRIYKLTPPVIQKEIDNNLISKGINLGVLKGGGILNRLD